MKTNETPNAVDTAAACSPPLGESGEAYYCKRDDFMRYIAERINPARWQAGLRPLDEKTCEECYRILNDFARKWGCKPIGESPQPQPPEAKSRT